MRKAVALCALALMSLAPPSLADEPHRLAERLLKLMRVDAMIEAQQAQMRSTIMPQIMQVMKGVGVTDEVEAKTKPIEERIFKLISSEVSWEKMKGDYADLYAKEFSEKELRGLITFYESEPGQALVAKQPELLSRSAALSQAKLAAILPQVQDILREELQRAGAVPPGGATTP